MALIWLYIAGYSQFDNLLPASIIPGLQELSDDYKKTLISQKLIDELYKSHYPIPDRYITIKSKNLVCYNDIKLHEVVAFKNDTVCLYYLLQNANKYHLMDGRSIVIHDLNSKEGVVLNNLEQTFEYLNLFVNSLNHTGSRFRIIHNVQELEAYMLKSVPKDITIKKPSLKLDNDGSSYVIANVLYNKLLYKVKFTIPEDGKVNMVDDNFITELEIMCDSFRDGCLRFYNLINIYDLESFL